MDNKSKLSDVFEQIAKDLPIISELKQMDDKVVDNKLVKSSEKYLDLLSDSFIAFDINPKDLSRIEESVVICNKLMSLSDKFELKRTNLSMVESMTDLQTCVHSVKEKLNDSVREMKSQTSFESEMSDKIKFYSTKSKEYYNYVKTKETNLSKIGFTTDLKQESIQQIRDNNEELRNRLTDTNAKLNEYKDFNPNESDLKKRINDLKVELSELDHIFNKL